MKKLCFGSFVNVLKLCMAASVTQKQLCRTILLSVASASYDVTIDDTLISNLVRCERNVAAEVTTPATTADASDVAQYFHKNVLPLLDGNKTALIILALKEIIADDSSIDGKTLVEKVSNTSKENLLSQSDIYFPDFLAGIFLYVAIYVKNTDGKTFISDITL